MFDLQEQSPLSYFKQLSPTHRFGKVLETTIEKSHPLPSALNPDSIKVLSWNIAKNNHDRQWSQDFLAIVELYQPDKIFLQEVRLCAIAQSGADAIARQIPELASMGWVFAPNLIDTFDNTYSGVLTATKADRLQSKVQITKHQEPVTGTPKVSLFVELDLGNDRETLLSVNTHLINFVETSKFQHQLEQIEATIEQHRGAVIFLGDFNTWNRYRWKLLLQMAEKLNLNPVTFSPLEAQKIKRFFLSPPLDYIFYRGLKQKIASAKVIDNISSSDHNPLLVEFYLS
jgi:endonuclease/exonuclease/phosphatase (EEP) superfamily protein YafD